ncbi:MAG: hypothetical protein ABIB93_05695 [Chloroflexota bacterium]
MDEKNRLSPENRSSYLTRPYGIKRGIMSADNWWQIPIEIW